MLHSLKEKKMKIWYTIKKHQGNKTTFNLKKGGGSSIDFDILRGILIYHFIEEDCVVIKVETNSRN